MAAPSMTFNTAGNALASQSLANAGTVTFNLDLSAKFEGQVEVKVVEGGTVAATAGVRVDVFAGYGSTPTYTTVNPNFTMTVPAGTATVTVYSPKIYLPTGKYQVKLTNLDATNAVTVEATMDTVDAVA